MALVTQIPNGDWFEYIPQAGPVFKCVAGTLLARFANMDEGLNTVYIQIREAGNSIILATSAIEAFFVANTHPEVDAEITSGAGNCGKFAIGHVPARTYSMSDLHSGSLSLSVTPSAEASGGHLSIMSASLAAPQRVGTGLSFFSRHARMCCLVTTGSRPWLSGLRGWPKTR